MTANESSFFVQAYDAAVQLNNVAVSLMERRCFLAAVSVINDALAVFQCAMGTATSQSQPPLSLFSIEDKLERALLKLDTNMQDDLPALIPWRSADGDSEGSSSNSDSDHPTDDTERDTLPVVSFSVLDQRGYRLKHSGGRKGSRVAYLFFIESNQPVSCCPQLTSSLLLHNHGQLCRCLAGIYRVDHQAHADALLEGASRLFFLSRALLEELAPDQISSELLFAMKRTKKSMNADLGLV